MALANTSGTSDLKTTETSNPKKPVPCFKKCDSTNTLDPNECVLRVRQLMKTNPEQFETCLERIRGHIAQNICDLYINLDGAQDDEKLADIEMGIIETMIINKLKSE